MRGRHLGFAAASACTAVLIFPVLGPAALAAPTIPAEPAAIAQRVPPPPDTGPYVVQCLDNGMARWNDGTIGYSEWCATGNGSPHGPDGYGPMGAIDPALPPLDQGRPGGPMTPGLPV